LIENNNVNMYTYPHTILPLSDPMVIIGDY